MTLDSLLLPTLLGPNEYGFEVPAGWKQGRGVFGGLIVGALVRSMEQLAGPERALRSVTSEICGPTQTGAFTVKVEMLREGSAVSTIAARLLQNSEVQAHAVGVFGKSRADHRVVVDMPRPDMPDWRAVEVAEVGPPVAPEFTPHFEFRLISGVPFSGSTEARTSAFVKPKNPGTRRDAAWVAATADACWPALFATETELRPIATIAYTLQLIRSPEGLDPEAPLYYRATDVSIREGYVVEFRELWAPDGQLIALNQQTIAIIR